MKSNDVAALVGAFATIQGQLHATNALLLSMHAQTTEKLSTLDTSFTNLNAQQTALSQKLYTLDTSLTHIESRAQSFHNLQLSQFENQNAFHSNLQKKIQATREKLQAIDTTASDVGQNINDLSFLLGKLSSLGGIVGTLVAWK